MKAAEHFRKKVDDLLVGLDMSLPTETIERLVSKCIPMMERGCPTIRDALIQALKDEERDVNPHGPQFRKA